jgi:CubicO group peptidase (beta-lactamase class C family)
MPPEADADLSNWRTNPFNRWAFRNVAEIVPSAAIDAGPGAPMPLPDAPASLDGFRLPGADGAVLDLRGFMQATAGDGLVILHQGRLVHESYANGNAPHAPHILMSATKSVVGLVVGALAASGEIDLETEVTDYLPEVAGTAFQGATLRQMLDMRTGVAFDVDQQRAYDAATGWEPAPGGLHGPGLHAFFAGLPPADTRHGGPFRYVSANTDLLGWAVERATGRSFAGLVSERLWKPMGAEDGAYITVDRQGAPRCTGGLCATVRDFARIGQLMVQGGLRDGVQVLPPAWLDDLADGGDAEAWRQGEFAGGFSGMTMRYRGGWYVIDDEPRTLFAMGIHGQNLFVDRANQLVIAKVSSLGVPIDFQAIALTHRAVAEFRRCLLGG